MNYTAFHFTVEPPQPGSEILIAHLGEFGFESFENTENGFTAYIPESEVRGVDLRDLKFDDFAFTFRKESISQVNWNAEWEKNFEPVKVGSKVIIRAPFHKPDSSAVYEIIIMPKMSFGTGHHQTTRLVCGAMCETDLKGKRVLDMGCGTGVLSILAMKLGATDVTGVDIDDWSVENAQENCRMNDCERITILKGDKQDLAPMAPFDVILANINRNILRRQMDMYAEKAVKGGTLILSGFFVTDVPEIISCAAGFGFERDRVLNENEWAMVQMVKL